MNEIEQFLAAESRQTKVLPPPQELFRALNLCSFDNVSVVIIGQDPYHGIGQANGLSFSVSANVPIPPSLKNIYQELADDIIGFQIPNHGDLESWAKQGVLLLNTCLTVSKGQANSHQRIGWRKLTRKIISEINDKKSGIVFILWGRHAQEIAPLIDKQKHLVLDSFHPSPMSATRGFFGCKHFSKTNEYLIKNKKVPIDWKISNITSNIQK